jgi:hypothetical protein
MDTQATAGRTEGIGAPGQGPEAPLKGSSQHEHHHDKGGEDESSQSGRVITPDATNVAFAPRLEPHGRLPILVLKAVLNCV